MKNKFRVGDRIHKKGDDKNCIGKIKEFREGKAYCEFNVLKINNENQLGLPLSHGKNIPYDKLITKFELVSLDELEYLKNDD